jgi:surface antigen
MLNLIQGDTTVNPDLINLINTVQVQQIQDKKEPTYTVKDGDNLSKIAKEHNTTWQRLWHKNTNLTNQDLLEVGTILIIPSPDEALTERPLYVLPKPQNTLKTPQNSSQGTSTGLNGYYAGQCTGYVASRRYVPAGWGDATNWGYAARSQGFTVSSTPVPGAIAWRSGHVAFTESVGAGTVTISEQNYDFNGSIRTITVPTSSYQYIY